VGVLRKGVATNALPRGATLSHFLSCERVNIGLWLLPCLEIAKSLEALEWPSVSREAMSHEEIWINCSKRTQPLRVHYGRKDTNIV